MEWPSNRSSGDAPRLPLLATKYHIARTRPGTIYRPRLGQRLYEGLRAKLTIVSAPAGFGKTTLLSGWIYQSRTTAAWVTLDEGDNSPSRFWDYVIASIRTVKPGLGA